MSREIQDILDECIDRVSMRGESLESCLRDFPDRAAELGPLLQVARSLSHMAAVEPRQDFKAEARYRLHMAITHRNKPSVLWRLPVFGAHRRWATSVGALLALFLIGGSTVGAASSSLPGDPLYGVKIATENVQLVVATSDASKVMLQVSLADNRVREMMALAEGGKAASIGDLVQRLNRHLATVEEAAAAGMLAEGRAFSRQDKERLQRLLESNAVRHMAVLENVMDRVPEQAWPSLQQAMMLSQRGYETALTASGGNLERVRSQWSRMKRWMGRPGSAGSPEAMPTGPDDRPSRDRGANNRPEEPEPDTGPGMMAPGQTRDGSGAAPQPPSGMGPGMMGPGAGPGPGRGMRPGR